MYEPARGLNAWRGQVRTNARNDGLLIAKGTMKEEIENDPPGSPRSIRTLP
jgi:hypothetical protein